MSYEIVCDSTDREAWLAARRAGIGSSDAPGVLGISPFTSPLSVYADKLGLMLDREATEAMKWGTRLEPLIIEEFGQETGRKVARASQLIRSTERPWQLATLDAEQEALGRANTGALEIKATGFRAGDWTEGVPRHVYAQVQHQLDVTGYDWGSVAVLMFGCRMLWSDVERDDAFIEKMRAAELDFWNRVQAREPVAPDGSASCAEALRVLYPHDTGEVVALPGDLIGLDAEREALKAEMKSSEHRVAYLDAEIKAALGSASVGELANGVSYTYRLQKRKAYEVKEAEFRVLRRSAPKGGIGR